MLLSHILICSEVISLCWQALRKSFLSSHGKRGENPVWIEHALLFSFSFNSTLPSVLCWRIACSPLILQLKKIDVQLRSLRRCIKPCKDSKFSHESSCYFVFPFLSILCITISLSPGPRWPWRVLQWKVGAGGIMKTSHWNLPSLTKLFETCLVSRLFTSVFSPFSCCLRLRFDESQLLQCGWIQMLS